MGENPVLGLRDWLPFYYGGEDYLQDIIEFDGPSINKIGDQSYISLTQYGVKEECAPTYPDDETRCWTEAEAVWRFKRTLKSYLIANPCKQLAWRWRPVVEQGPDGDYVVRCRFALLDPISQPPIGERS